MRDGSPSSGPNAPCPAPALSAGIQRECALLDRECIRPERGCNSFCVLLRVNKALFRQRGGQVR